MKKILFVMCAMFAMVACTTGNESNSDTVDSTTVDTTLVDSIAE